MPMETYERRVIAHASGQAPGPARVAGPTPDMSMTTLARSVDDVMKTVGPILAREYAATETARVDDAVIKAESRMNAWAEEYKAKAQGGLADPEEFVREWERIAGETSRDFEGNQNEVFRDLLRRKLSERGLRAQAEGLGFAARQREIFMQSQQQGQVDEFFRNAASHPDDIPGMLQEREELKGSLAVKNPGKDLTREFNEIDEKGFVAMAEGMLARGDAQGVRNLLASPAALSGGLRPLGEVTRKFESGQDGPLAIGYDQNGGTSYGPWQLSSKQGSYQEWARDYLARAGAIGREYAQAIMDAGDANTGTTSGRMVEVYRRIARENPQLVTETQRQYLKDKQLGPMLKSLPQDMRKLVEADDGLMQMAFSTAVQHGGKGGADVFRTVWRPGMDAQELVDAVYAERARPERFRKSTPQVREAVANRMREEAQAIHAYRGRRHVVDPHIQAGLLARAEALERQRRATRQDELRNTIDNYVAASEAGNVLDVPVTEGQLKQAYGEFQGGQLWHEVQASRELALDLNMLGNMTPQARANLLQAREADPASPTYRQDAGRQERLGRAMALLDKELAADAAGTMLRLDGNAARARQAFFENLNPQTARQYIAAMRGAMSSRGASGPLLSKQDAAMLATIFEQGDDPAAFAERLQAACGRDYHEIVDCISPSLSPLMRIAASGIPATDCRLIVQAARDKDFGKKAKELLSLRGSDSTDFEEAVAGAFGNMLQSFTAGGNTEMPVALREAVSSLAMQYMLRDGPAIRQREAISKAYDAVIGSRYDLLEHGGFFSRAMPPLRIPKKLYPAGPELDAGEVRDSLSHALDSLELSIDDIYTEEIPGLDESMHKEALADVIRQKGWWVNTGDDKGVTLFLNNNAVRLRKTGKPLTRGWDDLVSARRQDRAARQKEELRRGINWNNPWTTE